VARIGQLWGGRSTTDRDGDGVDDRAEARTDVTTAKDSAAETTTWRLRPKHDKDRDGVDDRVETKADTDGIPPVTTMDRETETLKPSLDRDPVTEPVPVRQAPARVSLLATLGLIFGVAGVAAALTGLLAPWAIAIGALGLLFSFGGIIAGVRPHVAGRGLGTLGVLLSGTAVVFGILALTGQVSWLDSDTDQVARLNDWLDARLPWMKDW